MKHADALIALLRRDTQRLRILSLVHSLDLPDCWIAAGFVRNAVWDFLHGRSPSLPTNDVDVIWFDPARSGKVLDLQIEQRLQRLDDSIDWSVKNQSRMHLGNDDPPYQSATDAMRFWPETATATAIRCVGGGNVDIAAPFGLDDLYAALVRPTPRFAGQKRALFDQRLKRKAWLAQWPLLRLAEPE
ncbi:MAG: nucleotidyltransferase family protein [Pseudomonadota bacterium]|nr:nucleotidyltransferase family protein [Pseudomonadota bacterium]